MKRALILDLDNTIYPVSSIAENLFNQLFTLIDENPDNVNDDDLQAAKDEMTRRPYQWVADKYNFSPELKEKGMQLLKNIAYNLPMQPFEEYHILKTIPLTRFLVTTGFSTLQWSKVRMLDIEKDFTEIHIVDPEVSTRTKRDVFADIMDRHGYTIEDILVIGDDPESEIKAATELGIDTFLFDPQRKHMDAAVTFRSANLSDVVKCLNRDSLD